MVACVLIMRNDILHTHIYTKCLRQYLFTIVVLRWLLVVVLFDHLGSSPGSRDIRLLYAVWHGT